jgi:hypothetical protein
MNELWMRAHEQISAGNHQAAAELLDRSAATSVEPVDIVNTGLAQCRLAIESEPHRRLLRPALDAIVSCVDVDTDPSLGPTWHLYRVIGSLLEPGPALEVHVRAYADVLLSVGAVSRNVAELAWLTARLNAAGAGELAAPLHRLAPHLGELPGTYDWATWSELAAGMRATGGGNAAAVICEHILEAAPRGAAWARAAITLGIHHSTTGRPAAARPLLNDALTTAVREGLPDLADTARSNLIACLYEAGDREQLRDTALAWLDDIAHKRAAPPAPQLAVRTSRALRGAEAVLPALDLLGLYADHDWANLPSSLQLEWLEEFTAALLSLSDDVTAAELCTRSIALDERLSRSSGLPSGWEDQERIARAYELLVRLYAEIERADPVGVSRTLDCLEAAKEAAFSRAVPDVMADRTSTAALDETRALVTELAGLEAALEDFLRRDLTFGDGRRQGRDRRNGLVVRAPHENERDREERAREIRDRLRALRRTPVSPAFRPRSFLDAAPHALSRTLWPVGTACLAYRLDRDENELVTYLLAREGSVRRFATRLNPVVLDALQTVLTQFPEDELDYVVERLTELLLPDRLLSALHDSGAHTVVVSGDPVMPSVPWEALGTGDRRLGLDFALCRTPSLLRTAALLGGGRRPPMDRALIVADPTGDLPGAAEEAETVRRALAEHGVEATRLLGCTAEEFRSALPGHSLVHFAGHTNYLRSDPPSSHLLFADGPLTVAELAHTATREGAVYVFGSCESAQHGTATAYGNTFGVSAAFLLKEAAAVVGCNWPADDRVTRAGTERLYEYLLAGHTVSVALKSARRDLFAQGHPTSSWALFSVTGDPSARLFPAE